MREALPVPASAAETRRQELRRLVAADELLQLPGVYDGFSARCAQAAGFAGAYVTGSGLSESRHALPDLGLIGKSEMLDGARMIAGCIDIPVIADADTGYGDAMNVAFTLRAFESAGVAGVQFEDQTWPKKCGHMAGRSLVSDAEMVGKIRAAVDARTSELVVVARTDAGAIEGAGKAIARAKQYADAGADVVFPDGLLAEADIEAFVSASPVPVLINMGFGIRRRSTTPLLSPSRLHELGVAVAIYPRMLTAAAVRGMQLALEALRASVATAAPSERPDLLVPFEELQDLMSLDEILALQQKYVD